MIWPTPRRTSRRSHHRRGGTPMHTPETHLTSETQAERERLADLFRDLSPEQWDTPSLCAGWRVREVVAHMTMPARYSREQFAVEIRNCAGDFTRWSNVVAARDGALPTGALVGNLRDEMLHNWTPPGGGHTGALNHV